MPSPNFKLFTCCEYFKILVNNNEGSYHNALFDTIMTSKLLVHLYKQYSNINDNEFINDNGVGVGVNKEIKTNTNTNTNANANTKMNQNFNKKRERKKNYKKNEKSENKQENSDNNNKINEEEDKKDIQNNQSENNNNNNNEISEGKLNGVELNLMIKRMNEMIVNEENKEKKNEEK